MKLLKWMTRLCAVIITVPLLYAGQEVQKATDPKQTADSKQIEAPVIDAKQIETSDDMKKPAWLTELSVTTKETYDSNVFGADVSRPSNSAAPVANVSSWLTSVTPKIGLNFASLLDYGKDEQKTVEVFSLSYAPEVVRYSDAASENYEAHRVATQIKGRVDSFSYNLEDSFVYVDGNRNTPQYLTQSAYGTAIARERREQIQDRGLLILRNDWDKFFVRAVGSATYYDLNSYHYNPVGARAGWQNYVDRYDVNAGGDIGYKITNNFAATLGYRRGYQYQESFDWSTASSNNDYDRILAGIEGKPLKWLKIELQAGPDFHYYNPSNMSVGHAEQINSPYIDGNVSAEVTSKDTLTARVKQWQWVSSTGTASYQDSTYEFIYKRKWLKQLSSTIGVMVQDSHYNAPTDRDDWLYTYAAGLKYDLNEYCGFFTDYSYSRGENGVDGLTGDGREFERHLVTIGVKGSF